MFFTLPVVVLDRDAFSALFLDGVGPVVGYRADAESLLVCVHVERWTTAGLGLLTEETVLAYVQERMGY